MSSFKTNSGIPYRAHLKQTQVYHTENKATIPNSMFAEAQTILSQAILWQQCGSGKNSATKMKTSFLLLFFPLSLLLPPNPKKGLQVHLLHLNSIGISTKHIAEKQCIHYPRAWGLQNKWHCQKEKRLHLGQLTALWPSKRPADSIKAVCCQCPHVCA